MNRSAIALGIALFVTGCRPFSEELELSPGQLEVNRCHEGIRLHDLVLSAGVPPQGRGWGTPSVAETMEGRLFDIEQETTLALPVPTRFTQLVCSRLRQGLESACTVESWSGGDFCGFETTAEATTNGDGHYQRRGSEGRVFLIASPAAGGQTVLRLTATEWAN